MRRNNKLTIIFLLVGLIYSCKGADEEEINLNNEIIYTINDSLTTKIIIDSIIRDKTSPIRHCIMDYNHDTLEISFRYMDDNVFPITDDMVKKTNRFLKVENEKIPIVFNTDFLFIEYDSTIHAEGRSYGYNWMNYAKIKLYPFRTLVSYENFYFMGGKEVSEKGRKKRLEREKLEGRKE